MNPASIEVAFPPENVTQVLDLVTWALAIFGAVWLVTAVIGARHRRSYNLTHAESGGSKQIQPDFLTVDTAKREAAMARGEQYGAQLKAREAGPPRSPSSPVSTVSWWSRVLATTTALIGLLFTALTTLQRVSVTDSAVRDLGNWEKVRTLVGEHPIGATLCLAVIASNVYIGVRKLRKPAGD